MEATLSKTLNNLNNMLHLTIPYMRGKKKTIEKIVSMLEKYGQKSEVHTRTWGMVVESQNFRVSVSFHSNGIVDQTKIKQF